MVAVRPSGEMSPASGGMLSGSAMPVARGAPASAVTRARTPAGSSLIGIACRYTTTGFSAPSAGKSRRSSSRTSCAVDPCASQPAPESAPFNVMASGAAVSVTTSQKPMTNRRRRAEKPASRANHALRSGGADGSWAAAAAAGGGVDVTVIALLQQTYPGGYPKKIPRGVCSSQLECAEVTMQLPDEVVDDVRKRLRRVAGQVQAVERMLAEGQECRDVVTQVSAATKALEQAGFKLVAAGLTYCLEHPDEAAADGYPLETIERMFLRLA